LVTPGKWVTGNFDPCDNPKKFPFGRKEIDFAGFMISEDGLKPTASIMDAIQNFPTPQNITDARSWFGLVNQVRYSISTSSMMVPFRELLKPGNWYWDSMLDAVFENSRKAIIDIIKDGVRSFEPNRPRCLATDWSKQGLGFTLLQKHCRCSMTDAPNCCHNGWRLIFAGSRFTTDAESRYAPVEGEALAVTYAFEKCRMFTLGCSDLTVVTDHKPVDEDTRRCQLRLNKKSAPLQPERENTQIQIHDKTRTWRLA
jgi:hypothetical protein